MATEGQRGRAAGQPSPYRGLPSEAENRMIQYLRIATRGSPLARWQADYVADLLRRSIQGLEVEVIPITTTGDWAS